MLDPNDASDATSLLEVWPGLSAEERIAAHAEDVDFDRAQAALQRAINRIRVARG